jgi:hypothetical protein
MQLPANVRTIAASIKDLITKGDKTTDEAERFYIAAGKKLTQL